MISADTYKDTLVEVVQREVFFRHEESHVFLEGFLLLLCLAFFLGLDAADWD